MHRNNHATQQNEMKTHCKRSSSAVYLAHYSTVFFLIAATQRCGWPQYCYVLGVLCVCSVNELPVRYIHESAARPGPVRPQKIAERDRRSLPASLPSSFIDLSQEDGDRNGKGDRDGSKRSSGKRQRTPQSGQQQRASQHTMRQKRRKRVSEGSRRDPSLCITRIRFNDGQVMEFGIGEEG